jgi:arylsulfatase A-like enzyme
MRQTVFIVALCLLQYYSSAQTQPNIIFVICDDLNDYVEALNGQTQVETPNISALTSMGTTFENAYCSGPLCAPSRTSIVMGKMPDYTGIYINGFFDCFDFRANFPDDKYVLTFPQYLKDEGGYFTYNIGKLFHCDFGLPDFDEFTTNMCEKEFSWNKFLTIGNDDTISNAGQAAEQGLEEIKWAMIDSGLVSYMADYQMVDSASKFIRQYSENPADFCSKPFMLSLGFRRPHSNLYIPEQYFLDDYVLDIYAEPWNYNYNQPYNAYPANGLVMPPNPDPPYNDYYTITPLGREQIALAPYNEFDDWPDSLDTLPLIDAALTDEQREDVLTETKRANAIMAYLAAIKFVDEQFGRFMDSLSAYPEIYNNTIIVFTSDHGYSWGEKKHYGKASMYETDIRVPLFITDLRNVHPQVTRRTVSLVDLFPTICDWAGIEYPVFPDGSPYLDGHSLTPVLMNADTTFERPVVSQIKNSFDGNVCFPQNSVRDERFHFIQYTSNGVGDTCNEASAIKQNELYEIGFNRDVDPYEWKNLADSAGYESIVSYYESFLPGGSNYNKRMFDVRITLGAIDCFAGYEDTIHLSAELFDNNGNLITEADSLADFTFVWKNSLTNASFSGTAYDFAISSLTAADYDENNKIIFYLTVRRADTVETVAYDVQYVYINPANTPSSSYVLTPDSASISVSIDAFIISGDYLSVDWDFGDGYVSHDFFPAPHTYAEMQSYIITNTIHYGNGCTLVNTDTIFDFAPIDNIADIQGNTIGIYPNPSSGRFTICLNDAVDQMAISIMNLRQEVLYNTVVALYDNKCMIDASALPGGTYILYLHAENISYAGKIIVTR